MNKIYQLKIILKESNPPIWRRFMVSEDINLHKLHEIIQAVMGWEDTHLYTFIIKGQKYHGQPEFDEPEKENEENKDTLLNEVINKEKQTFYYGYDFGDNWEHDIILEKITPKESGKFYPVCIEGENACPPEDIGGIYGYYEALERLKNGNLDKDEIEFIFGDEEFNPEEFDIEQVNDEFKEYFGINQEALDKYKEPVIQLISLGSPGRGRTNSKKWLDYSSLGIAEDDIPQLIEVLQDKDLYYSDSELGWAILHSWRALGQLKAKKAIIPLIDLLVNEDFENDDWIGDEIPVVLGMIGEDCIEPLKAYLYEQSKPECPKVMIAQALEKVGQNVLSKRDEIIKIFSEFLEQATKETSELNAFIIGYLTDLKAVEVIDIIRNAYSKDIVDFAINGDLEDTEIELGLKKKRTTPRPHYEKKFMNLFPAQSIEQVKSVKVGRNEPCPCGSGKKYKKCCLE